MRLPNGRPLEFILAVPGRRYVEFAERLDPINQEAKTAETPISLGFVDWCASSAPSRV